MAKQVGKPTFAVTATVARIPLGDPASKYTMKNNGSGNIYYRFDPRKLDSGMSGDATALATAECSLLEAGDAVVVGPGVTDMYIVCATAVSSTVSVMAGALASDTSIGTVTGTFTAAALGDTSDAPVADNTTVESATARTGISLWKRIVNVLIAILAKQPSLGTAGTPSTNVISVQGVGGGTAIPVSGSVTATVSGVATEATLASITGTGYTIKHADINAVTGTTQALIAAVPGKSIQVVGGHLECGVAAGPATILNAAAVIDRLNPGIGTSISIQPRPMSRPVWTTTTGSALNITTTATQTFTGSLEYIEV